MLGNSVCERQRTSTRCQTDLNLTELAPGVKEVEGQGRVGCGSMMQRSLVDRLVLLDDRSKLRKIGQRVVQGRAGARGVTEERCRHCGKLRLRLRLEPLPEIVEAVARPCSPLDGAMRGSRQAVRRRVVAELAEAVQRRARCRCLVVAATARRVPAVDAVRSEEAGRGARRRIEERLGHVKQCWLVMDHRVGRVVMSVGNLGAAAALDRDRLRMALARRADGVRPTMQSERSEAISR